MEPMEGKQKEEYEAMARAKLEAMGFEMCQKTGLWATVGNTTFLIDFSAIDTDKYLFHAMSEAYTRGMQNGKDTVISKVASGMREIMSNL